MTRALPLRFRRLADDTAIVADEAGRFFRSNMSFVSRLADGHLTPTDKAFLDSRGFLLGKEDQLNETSFLYALAQRLQPPKPLSYVILIPTLRCDLSCAYCQVSRAAQTAKGYDWSEETLQAVLQYLDEHGGESIQIEFQGGEPSLRLDLLERVVQFARARFSKPQFVVCTNLSSIDSAFADFMASEDVYISTSLDGPSWLHEVQRTQNSDRTSRFFSNLSKACDLAPGRVHGLPTLDVNRLPDPNELLDAFDAFGLRSIYLRPVSYYGFARKHHPTSVGYDPRWSQFYNSVIHAMISRNTSNCGAVWEEFYLTHLIKRLLRPGENSHADIRSPNWLGHDHLVIDYDGVLYPTDEARMLARTGQVDLNLGNVQNGLDLDRRVQMQAAAFNALDPWCSRCPYQSACGRDPIDDLARHGHVNPPRPRTAFCQRHTHLFDLAVSLIYSDCPATQLSLSKWLELPVPTKLGEQHL